jgi:outer membrane protein TolC
VAAYESTLALRAQKTELEKVGKLVELKYQARVAEKTDWLRVQENQLQVQNQLAQAENQLDATAAEAGILRTGKIISSEELHRFAPKLKSSLQECEADFLRPAPLPGELRPLQRLVILQQQLEAQIQVAENTELPQVDLLGAATARGRTTEAGTPYPPMNQKDYSVRLQAQYPLGNPKAQGDVGQARAGLVEVGHAQELAKRDLTLALWQMQKALQTLQTVTSNNQAWVKLAEEKLELNLRNYRIGRLDTFLLLDSVNAVIAARLQEVQSAIQFKRLLVSYLSLSDRILPQYPDLLRQLREGAREVTR